MDERLELARQQWQEGWRRVQAEASRPDRYERLLEQVEAVTVELRRRVGGTFTLAELAQAYEDSDRWTYGAITERSPHAGWARSASTAADAAFHEYSQAAKDYRP